MPAPTSFLDLLRINDQKLFNKVNQQLNSIQNDKTFQLIVHVHDRNYSLDELSALQKYWDEFIPGSNPGCNTAPLVVTYGPLNQISARFGIQQEGESL